MNIKELMEQYKINFDKLEKATKNESKREQEEREKRTEQSELFYKLQDKEINGEEYTKRINELHEEQEKAKEQKELATIERKLLQDNENILKDKIVIDIYKNILVKYNQKAIGEQTTA